MSTVTVSGYVPRREIGEMEYDSAIYHIFLNENGKPKFLVWNPYLNELKGDWEIVGASAVRPAVLPSQSLKTKKQREVLKRMLEVEATNKREGERQDDNE